MSAVTQRYSVRAFLDKPVSKALLEKVLRQAQQSPSGGNLQPWHVYVTAGEDREAFLQKVQLSVKAHPAGEPGALRFIRLGSKNLTRRGAHNAVMICIARWVSPKRIRWQV